MSDFVRRIVSGNKARFKDSQLNLELDLVYVTDNIIIMGFPATGVEGFYRNRREDAKKFLEHRHGKNYWIFNFCPLRENSYPAEYFDGRVSRYPFPDHHAPPLAILPLAAREIREWLSGFPERVAVLHCKAGKGRSGTLACAYLLSLESFTTRPKIERNMSKKEQAKARADQLMETVETDDMSETVREDEETRLAEEKKPPTPPSEYLDVEVSTSQGGDDVVQHPQLSDKPVSETPRSMSPLAKTYSTRSNNTTNSNRLDDVLALHTSRRMKTPSSDSKGKQGVSIPSQRRWLYYWSLLLANEAPRDFWADPPVTHKRRVRVRQITVRVRELTGVKMNLLKLANNVMERTNASKGSAGRNYGANRVWVSLARYNDDFVELLERWERHSRGEEGKMGTRRPGSDQMEKEAYTHLFADGKWDKVKMIKSFMRLGDVGDLVERDPSDKKNSRIVTHTLKPLSDRKWKTIEEEIESDAKNENGEGGRPPAVASAVTSTARSVTDFAQTIDVDNAAGAILNPDREVRVKIYMGQIFMGWFWFIPIFHMPQPLPTTSSPSISSFDLARSEIDFALGAGASIINVSVVLEWLSAGDAATTKRDTEPQPPPTQTSMDSAEGRGSEPAPGWIVTGLQAATSGGRASEAIDATEAASQ